MSPLEKLKNGFLNQNWDMVRDAYESLTGESLSIGKVKKKRGRPKKIKILEATEQDLLEADIINDIPAIDERPSRSSGPVQFESNKFIDTMKEYSDITQEDKKALGKIGGRKSIEYRPEHKMVRANCSVCNKSQLVDPAYLYRTISDEGIEKYKYICNDCQAGGARSAQS